MLRPLRHIILAVLFFTFSFSNAWALVFEIAYDKTYSLEEISYWKMAYGSETQQIFGVNVGPALLHMSLLLNTEAAPILYYAEASTFHFPVFGDRTLAHNFYGYANDAISNLIATFGNKTWGLEDLRNPNFGLGVAGLWMDAPLINGGTSDIVLDLEDSEGRCTIGWMWMNTSLLSMYQDGRADIMDYAQPYTLFGVGGVATIHAVNSVPEPTTMLLLGLGFIGLTVMRRKMQR